MTRSSSVSQQRNRLLFCLPLLLICIGYAGAEPYLPALLNDTANYAVLDSPLDPVVAHTGTWTKLNPANSPSKRFWHAAAYDKTRQEIILFGGVRKTTEEQTPNYGYISNNETWRWDGSNWTQLFPGNSPSKRFDHVMEYDPVRGYILLHGGEGEPYGTLLNDTWIWDGSNWIEVHPDVAPPVRYGMTMSFDYSVNRIALFAGENPGYYNDTWEWDGTNWQERQTNPPPHTRAWHAMAFHRVLNCFFVFGGYDRPNPVDPYLGDTWKLAGNIWTQLDPADNPVPDAHYKMAYDHVRERMYMWGRTGHTGLDPQMYEYDGINWYETSVNQQPSIRFCHSFVRDEGRDQIVLFGGHESSPNSIIPEYNDTWVFTGPAVPTPTPTPVIARQWHKVTEGNPPARAFHAMVYQASRSQTLLFGGWNSSWNPLGDTWEWNGRAWLQRTPSQSPSPRSCSAIAYDSLRGKVVLFGGVGSGNSCFNDTWEWDGINWVLLDPATKPTARQQSAMVFDQAKGKMLLFGGVEPGYQIRNDTWEWDGSNWTLLNPANRPQARHNHMMAYDAERNRTVLFGGDPGVGSRTNDTWEWDGTNWSLKSVIASPYQRAGAGLMTYDSQRKRVVLCGGAELSVWLTDMWEWNGTKWEETNVSPNPFPRNGHSVAFDSSQTQTILYGGYYGTTFYNDTWIYGPWQSPPQNHAPVVSLSNLWFSPQYLETKITPAQDPAWGEHDGFGDSVAMEGNTAVIGTYNGSAAYVYEKANGVWTCTAKLTSSRAVEGDYFGRSVAISGDVIVVGAYADDSYKGSAYVFVKPSGGWTSMTETAKLTAFDSGPADGFGHALSISGDTIVVAAHGHNISANGNEGAVYIYVKPGDGWTTTSTYTAKLTASDGDWGDELGWSVFILGDQVAAGAFYDDIGSNLNQGSVYIYTKPHGGWTSTSTYTAKLTAPDGASDDCFGNSVCLTEDSLLVGSYRDDFGSNVNQGSVYLFSKPSGGWISTSTCTAKLTASDGAGNDEFGCMVSRSGDVIAVGAWYDNGYQGSVYLFLKPSEGWTDMTENRRLTGSDSKGSSVFGCATVTSNDTLLVGSYGYDNGAFGENIGSAYAFQAMSVYTEDGPALILDNALILSDIDSTNLSGAVVQIIGNYNSDQDVLGFANQPGISGTWDAGIGTLTLSGTASVADYQTALRTITYGNTSDNPSTAIRTVSFQVSDGMDGSNIETRQIVVQPVNDSPNAFDDSRTTSEDAPVSITVRGNDFDVEGDALSVVMVGVPSHGQTSLNPDQTVTYIPSPDYHGTDSFTYTIADGNGGFDTADVMVSVTPANDAPVATDDTLTSSEDTLTLIPTDSLSANDSDADGDSLSIINVSEAINGTAVLDGTVIVFNPTPNFNGIATFTYTLSDGNGGSADATVTINVTPVNDPPVTDGYTAAATDEDTSVIIEFHATDPEGDPLRYSVVEGPYFGTLSEITGNVVTYTPNANQYGFDNFWFIANDGALNSESGYVHITINPINDSPVVAIPITNVEVNEDAPSLHLDLSGTFSDADIASGTDSLTLSVSSDNPALLTASISGTALTLDFLKNGNGAAHITVTATDIHGVPISQTFNALVNPVNDAPVFAKGANQTVDEDSGPQFVPNWATSISAGPSDESDQSLSFVATNNNPSLFAVPPAVSADGELTYSPAPNANGVAEVFVVLRDSGGMEFDGVDSTPPQIFTVTVNPVNDVPVVAQSIRTVSAEEDAASIALDLASVFSDVDVATNEDELLLSIVSVSTPDLLAATLTGTTLTLDFTADQNGSAEITVRATDQAGFFVDDTFTVVVNPINDSPVVMQPLDKIDVLEDAAPVVVDLSATFTDVDASTNEDALTLAVSYTNPSLVAATLEGTLLTLHFLADQYGLAEVSIAATDRVGSSVTEKLAVNAAPVNDAPSFGKGVDQVVLEDAGEQTVIAWASNVTCGPADESNQELIFHVTCDNPSLFAAPPQFDSSGTLTFTPALDANGSTLVSVVLQDTGGTENGGLDTSTAQTFGLTVLPVNDSPSFAMGAHVTVLEDSGAFSQTWATAIVPGPANESTQTVTFTVTNDNNDLFTVQPGIDSNGFLTFTSIPNANGIAMVTVVFRDNGGTENGGTDTTLPIEFLIAIEPVNDAPSFVAGGDLTLNEGSGAQMVPGWASSILAGPNNEAAQLLEFHVAVDRPDLFEVPPAVDSSGTLTFTPASGPNGESTVTVTLQDNGGTDNGGVVTSAPQTFKIALDNVAPTAALSISPSAIQEGQSTTLSVSITDPGVLDDQAISIDWGDGSAPTSSSQILLSSSYSHVYVNDNATDSYTISVTVTDDRDSNRQEQEVVVTNANPVSGPIQGLPASPVRVGIPITGTMTVNDPGSQDIHTALWNWGDGVMTNGTVTENNGSGTVSGGYAYAAPGIYSVTCTVQDPDGGVCYSNSPNYVLVYNPASGSIKGAGIINSPEGSYIPNPTMSGKAFFKVDAQYGNTVLPNGKVSFDLSKAVDWSFTSTSLDWLVINGAYAKVLGAGTINGTGNYRFLLTARDGDVLGKKVSDQFRIKIWNSITGQVIYDTVPKASDDGYEALDIENGHITTK